MTGLDSYLAMGGYADFVWPSYALTVVVMIVLAIASFRAARIRAAKLRDLQASSPHRQRRAAQPVHDKESVNGL